MLLVLTCLAIATHTVVSLPQPESQLTARKEALEAEDAERSDVAEDSTEEEASYDEYLKLCNTLGIPPISVGSGYGYTAPYTNYGGSSNYGRYPSYGGYSSYGRPNGYGGYPSYTYPSSTGGYNYYRGNPAGRSAEAEATEEDIEATYAEYVRVCSNLGIPPVSIGSGYTNYGGSSAYGGYGGYPVYGGNTGYVSNYGYTGYPAYS